MVWRRGHQTDTPMGCGGTPWRGSWGVYACLDKGSRGSQDAAPPPQKRCPWRGKPAARAAQLAAAHGRPLACGGAAWCQGAASYSCL